MTSEKKGKSSIQLTRYINVTQKQYILWSKELDIVFNRKTAQLDGIVEVDETFIGCRWRNTSKI